MNTEELKDKLMELENQFLQDEEVIQLTQRLKERFDQLFGDKFTGDEVESSEFDQMSQEYYYDMRDGNDPDDFTIFQVMWFK